jgi:glutamine synthetase
VVGRSLTGSTWAPAYISYGDNNRSAMVRIPKGRLELRLPDGSCNPYLATAAVIAAGLDGVERQLDPGEPRNVNLYDWTEAQLGRSRHRPAAAEPERRAERAAGRPRDLRVPWARWRSSS